MGITPCAGRRLVIAATLSAGTAVASAWVDWSWVSLHPPGTEQSWVRGLDGSRQAGTVQVGGTGHAALWNGTAASWTDLHPPGAGPWGSTAYATADGQQVGYARFGGGPNQAGLWMGTADSWVSLHPAGAFLSEALDTNGAQQAGFAAIGGANRAGIWHGTSASWVNLHPGGAAESVAYAMTGAQQAGFARFGGNQHASIWSGTAASWVDLHPAGAVASGCFDTNGSQQVGWTRPGVQAHAAMWAGTADSWISLHPPGAQSSQANAVSPDGEHQVGQAVFPGSPFTRAVIWRGTADSWLDLHSVLPAEYYASYATSVFESDGLFYVGGYAIRDGIQEAILWVPEPASAVPLAAALLGVIGARRRVQSSDRPQVSA